MSCAPNASTLAVAIELTGIVPRKGASSVSLGQKSMPHLAARSSPTRGGRVSCPVGLYAGLGESSGMIVLLQHCERLNALEDGQTDDWSQPEHCAPVRT